MAASNSAPESQPAATARQWQLAHGQSALQWMRSFGVTQRLLMDLCIAVETTVEWLVHDDAHRARWVIQQYPRVLTCCDVFEFNDPAPALAYRILHLPDHYWRMFQVRERLLLSGRLPWGDDANSLLSMTSLPSISVRSLDRPSLPSEAFTPLCLITRLSMTHRGS
jgi:hypothetical protein